MDEPRSKQNAVIYCRVSSERQVREGHGLNSQDTRCREYARVKGYIVTETFHDAAQSGKLLDRPQMKAMLSFLRKHQKDEFVVIVDDISRLARDIETHIQLRAAITAAGAKLESPSITFGEDSDSRLVEHLLASVAAHQREKNAEQVKNRMCARVQNGYWVAPPPVGYRYKAVRGHGKMLVRKEPQASIVQEALESFASGRLETQTEVRRFLESHPAFPRGRDGRVHYQRVHAMLTHPLYAGRITLPRWGIHNLPGKHEALISYETYRRVQERLEAGAKAPARKDLRRDFPLRNFVMCCGCGEALTSGWTKGRSKYYGYYLCHRKSCSEYGKAIKKDAVEGDFEELLRGLRPSREVYELCRFVFRGLYDERVTKAEQRAADLKAKLKQIEGKTESLLDRIVDSENSSVIAAYEKRVRSLEEDKIVLEEKLSNCGRVLPDFDRSFRTAFDFLQNPHRLWASGQFEHKRMVLRMVFTDRMPYHREEGFRTAPITLPFRLLRVIRGGQYDLVPKRGLEPSQKARHVPGSEAQVSCVG